MRKACAAVVMLGAFLSGSAVCWAGKGPTYTYGEAWWSEYVSDNRTALLLHFGPPEVTRHLKLKTAVDEKKKEEELLSLEAKDQAKGVGGGLETMSLDDMKLRPVDEASSEPDAIFDYSDRRLKFKLAPGLAFTPDGRFGQGLKCSGQGSVEASANSPVLIECWFRFDSLPSKEQCILSFAGDESRLLLRPDGRVEFRLKRPQGIPDPKLPPEVIKAILQKDASIVSPDPLAAKTWTHVSVRNQSHPMPGGGEPFDAVLKVNGFDVANYMSERHNQYGPAQFFGLTGSKLVIGNSAKGDQGFVGTIDELRVSTRERDLYERPAMPWRDTACERPLQFNRPWFRVDGTVFHASLDKGLKLDLDSAGAGDIQINLRGQGLDGVLVDGVRGKGWLMDPDIGFARVPLKGMNLRQGALEFWLRPQNWDDCTGYWIHSPPLQMNLSVARLMARDKTGAESVALQATLPRAFNLERARLPLDPGHWVHLCLVWDEGGWGLFYDGKVINGARRDKDADLDAALTFAEFGVPGELAVLRNEKPRIEIDEVVGYSAHLRNDEVVQAQKRWMGKIEAIPLYNADFLYKWSIHKLEFWLTPLLPDKVAPASCTVSVQDMGQGGKAFLGPAETKQLDKDSFRFVLSDDKVIPYGTYQFRFSVKDAAGKVATEGVRDWKFEEEPWRHCRAGILEEVPPPWTPIQASATGLQTRMTRYALGPDGLPTDIVADGVSILAAPLQLLEDGKPMAGKLTKPMEGRDLEAAWSSEFAGATCDVAVQCKAEYDGMIRYELAIKPKGKVGRLAFVMPVKAANATRWLAHPASARGVSVGEMPAADGLALTSRADPASWEQWKAFVEAQKKDPKLVWESYWAALRNGIEAYGFYTHADLNDMNRGLWWFCDNAAGWAQSKTRGAVEIVRKGEVVSLELNLVAEPCDYTPGRPIVFGILPHPARPMPEKYRLFDKRRPDLDPKLTDVYDAFFPWPQDARGGGSLCMTLYPAANPKKRDAGPSWEYAESCIPTMKACRPTGKRSMYLSKAWFSCRAGAYDNWEWRSGETSEVALTPSFVNYLCWEMNEWIRRDFWDAVYLDECYEHPAKNLEAGISVLLPDGKEQPGVTNFEFRELMKRWRGIFHQNGREPFLMAHLTHSFQYPGIVFCDSYLDGENSPIVSLTSGDWIDSTSKSRFEVLQNARLWGVSSFYMPFIAEGGFENKLKSQFLRWQWRMARQAQSEFAHYETETVFEGQGGQVYKGFWNDLIDWGGWDEKQVAFVPYWNTAPCLKVEGQGKDTLVSFYRKPGQVFLIASNRRKQEAELRIELDSKALGIKEKPTVRVLDRTFAPPAGDDFTGTAAVRAEAGQAFEKGLGAAAGEKEKLTEDDTEALLVGEDGIEAKKRAALEPKLEGATLILPVRGKDYRVVVLE